MKSPDFQNLIKLQAFEVTGTWEQRIQHDSKRICYEIAREMISHSKIDRVLQLLDFNRIPKPYEAAFLSVMVEPIKNFQMYFILTDRSDTNFFFYFNPESPSLIHGEDAIGWVGAYIQLLGRAFKNIDSLGGNLEETFHLSSRLPKTKHNSMVVLTQQILESICRQTGYFLDFQKIGHWQVTIHQCPGLVLQIKCNDPRVQYGSKAAHALTDVPPSEWRGGLNMMALLHLNHILREAKRLEQNDR